jgi:hypothetical protein
MDYMMKSVTATGQMVGVLKAADYSAPAEEMPRVWPATPSSRTILEVIRDAVASEHVTPAMEREAAARARQSANRHGWGLNVALLLFAAIAFVVMLSFEGAPVAVVATAAITGLIVAWVTGWFKGRAAYPSIYEEELAGVIRASLVAAANRALT